MFVRSTLKLGSCLLLLGGASLATACLADGPVRADTPATPTTTATTTATTTLAPDPFDAR
ncbi:MAG: hypothetical protein GXP62_13700, partial [Oligoflexia bacterium]|nr:hypothetical protein [Oligoflexia bacterium]